jgi:lycopene beta-cyclase
VPSAGTHTDFDYVLVGGGLQNALIALAVLDARPSARVALVEAGASVGGNHTWSFHEDDVPSGCQRLVQRLVAARWDAQRVRFPSFERRLGVAYASISSERLCAEVERQLRRPGCRLWTRTAAVQLGPAHVRLSTGEVLTAALVVDARGPAQFESSAASAYQKFVGLELELARPGPWTEPVLMDANVPQQDGFRFVYVLPFSPERVLVEDTYFSDHAALDVPALRREVLAYAANAGCQLKGVAREERGVLPLPLRMPEPPACLGPLEAGVQGGWFHPTTGYSFPVALRLAAHVASVPPEAVFGREFRALVRAQWRQARFALLLNRLLYGAFPPDKRRHVLERFYRLPEPTIRRFYALTTTTSDRARIVCGRPPRGMSLKVALSKGIHA